MVGFDYNLRMDTLGARIRKARNAKRLTQQQLAEALGIDRVNISTWESNTTKPEASRLPRLADLLNTTESWLLSGKGDIPVADPARPERSRAKTVAIVPGAHLISQEKMPVYAAAQGGDGHVIVTFDAVDYVKRPAELENVRGGYGLLITGGSMIPAFWPGDMALVNPHLPPAREKNVILYHTPPHGGDVEAMVKQLNSWTDREWFLKQWNPAQEFTVFKQEWPVCHRVVGRYDAR